jgi:hypothetical protein
MDPLAVLTEALALATACLTLATKIWDVTPRDLQVQGAADWAKFLHRIYADIASLREKIAALTAPRAATP